MNNDLISREALKKALKNRNECENCTDIDCINCFYDIIDNAPTVETLKDITEVYCDITKEQLLNVLRPKGEWVENTDTVFKNRFNCSICGKLIFEPKEDNNFCPNCGADMRGGEE